MVLQSFLYLLQGSSYFKHEAMQLTLNHQEVLNFKMEDYDFLIFLYKFIYLFTIKPMENSLLTLS